MFDAAVQRPGSGAALPLAAAPARPLRPPGSHLFLTWLIIARQPRLACVTTARGQRDLRIARAVLRRPSGAR